MSKIKLPRAAGAVLIGSAVLGVSVLVAVPAVGQGGRPLNAILVGETEVPGPGHPTATGLAEVTLNQGQGSVCYTVVSNGLENVVMGHIHKGPAGVAGPIVVHFKIDGTGQAQDCADAERDLVKDIRKNPDQYYVNVHTSALPKGAIRGQLSNGHADFD